MKSLIFSAVLVLAFWSASLADPKLTVPEPRWDFGFVPQNSKLTHDYWVKNTGDDTLRIIRVKPG